MSGPIEKTSGESATKIARVELPEPDIQGADSDDEPQDEAAVIEESEDADFLEDFPDETEDLELVHSRISSLASLRLARFANHLKRLCLRQNVVSFLDPETFHVLVNLEELDLYDNKLKAVGSALDKLSNLKVLDLSFNLLKSVPEGLALLTSLHTVYFVQNKILRINGLEACTKLRSLELGGNRIRKIENLGALVNLEELWLGKNKITQLENLGNLKKLKILSLQSNRITKIENLEELESLEQLYFSHNGIKRIEGLERNTKLTTFDLGNNYISTIENLSHLSSLEELWLNGNEISDFAGLEPQLGAIKPLETLYLEANPCQKNNMSGYRRKVMLALPQLKQIDATTENLSLQYVPKLTLLQRQDFIDASLPLSSLMMSVTTWNVGFLQSPAGAGVEQLPRALIILNQPFSRALLNRVWSTCFWHVCADGGANRLYDTFNNDPESRKTFLPRLIKGDLDSIREDVKAYYSAQSVPVVQDDDQDTTDLQKCIAAIGEKELSDGAKKQYEIILLGGLAGRLDQTIHTLSCLHKLRSIRPRVIVVTDDSVGWVLDAGEHVIEVDHDVVGKTCGLLPVGVDSTVLTTSGLRWNLDNATSSFDGLVSTSNHLLPGEKEVRIETSRPIWWTVELKTFPETIMTENASSRVITVLYFAAASTAVNLTEERVALPNDEPFFLSSLAKLLSDRHLGTDLGKVLERSRWSVNEEMIDDAEGTELKGGEEVAVICPVSGG